ncbi:1-aminocyclopropane-1-carboxylate deaminase/D-cysteine desulfhydrase [uncultured Cocleimonas sp.]|uniref:1-aminocyclopropane-1-carboxylate deaminase/D-cysteine desulfhydrase n=1 Tax=uncultured Cocleimonas sp. TaxID=1051587 RepID=UPI002628D9F8|nr:pyridoxal-phosphate dependent enzyme [uncultured Cocleimonas sp.]
MQPQNLNIESVEIAAAKKSGVKLFMARADRIHPLASGNKFYKLKPHFEYAIANDIKQLVSFGGAFSNHIHALALMAKDYGLQSVGIIRGEQEYASNPTLTAARNAGMALEFVTRKEYQLRHGENYLAELQKRYPLALIIPEGGSSQLAIAGCATLTKDINAQHRSDIFTIASGTGASFAGLVCGLEETQQAISYAVLKDQSLEQRISSFINKEEIQANEYSIEQADYGGYAKFDETHLEFILDWLEQTGILLDPIYTSKMCRRLVEQLTDGQFEKGTSITMVHSGGLQGWLGMRDKVIKLEGESSWDLIQSYLLSE